jgi:predicted lipid-binding transport protein (Tim44 family)
MKIFSLLAAILTLGLTLTMADADAAKRVGGGASSGMQRNMNAPDKGPSAAPGQAPTSTAASPAQPRRSWMGPIAGLAAGLGLAALASYLGFGEELASLMMIVLLIMAVLVVVGLIMRRRAAAQQPALAGVGGMHYAASGPAPGALVFQGDDGVMPRSGHEAVANDASAHGAAPVFSARIPANFDVDGFARQAKVNFIRLQAANDAGNLDDLREFTTPEMFAELKTSLLGRGKAAQQTDVVEIDAEVLDVAREASREVVSVRYRGSIREDDGPAESFEEIWHLVKPRDGNDGWRLAGIQQTH